MSIWTAGSDVDYDMETGNGDLWEHPAECEKDAGWDDYLRQQFAKSRECSMDGQQSVKLSRKQVGSIPASGTLSHDEDDIAF